MPVRYGFIGAGAIAQRRHIPECAASPDCQVVAVTDIVAPRAKSVAQQYGARAFTDYRRMLQEAQPDAVVIATPNALHAPMSIDCLHAGAHVLCEKPMATTRADARAMIQVAQDAGKFLMIGLNQRLMPANVKAKEILQRGRLGRVLGFRTAFKHSGPESWSVDGQHSWFFRRADAAMGATGDLGVHKVDLLRWLLGQEFVRVTAMLSTLDKRYPQGQPIDLDDNAALLLQTDGGAVGSLIVSWTNYGPEENYTVLYCQGGVLAIGTDPIFGVLVQYREGDRELHQVGVTASNVQQVPSHVIDTFTRCILTNKPPSIDGHEGYLALDVILTAMDASESGRTLAVGEGADLEFGV